MYYNIFKECGFSLGTGGESDAGSRFCSFKSASLAMFAKIFMILKFLKNVGFAM